MHIYIFVPQHLRTSHFPQKMYHFPLFPLFCVILRLLFHFYYLFSPTAASRAFPNDSGDPSFQNQIFFFNPSPVLRSDCGLKLNCPLFTSSQGLIDTAGEERERKWNELKALFETRQKSKSEKKRVNSVHSHWRYYDHLYFIFCLE